MTPNRTKTSGLVAAASAASILLMACGGSDSSSESPAEPAAEQTQDTIDFGSADEIAQASGLPEACIELSLAISAATAGMVPGSEFDIESLDRSFDAIKGEAPEELRNDIEIVKKGLSRYLTVLSEYGNDVTQMMNDPEAMQRFAEAFDDEFSQASERFSQWMESVCTQ